MKTININISENPKHYPVFIGENILEKIAGLFDLKKYFKIAIVTDENIAKIFLEKLQQAIPYKTHPIIISPGEKAKNIETVKKIWLKLLENKFDRKSLIINLGGGVIGDMGGFAASTYMRGIDFLQIPTTLLSQVDASAGGKTGIDFADIKNLAGTFTQPIGVLIDVQTLTTLPKRIYKEGFGEIIKHGFIADKNYFETVTSKHPLEFSPDEMINIIAGSCEIKKAIIQEDETEKEKRKLLNFGHTIGHAIEVLLLETDKSLLHGEAISIGMIAEAKISELTGIFSSADFQTVKQSLRAAELPVSISYVQIDDILQKMQADK